MAHVIYYVSILYIDTTKCETLVNKIKIQKYIDILEKGYIIFRLHSFSRNLKNEIKRNRNIYFYENRIRNMIIGNSARLN